MHGWRGARVARGEARAARQTHPWGGHDKKLRVEEALVRSRDRLSGPPPQKYGHQAGNMLRSDTRLGFRDPAEAERASRGGELSEEVSSGWGQLPLSGGVDLGGANM